MKYFNYILLLKIVSPDVKEYEVPININKPNRKAKDPRYDVVVDQSDNFNFKIIRKSTGTVMYDYFHLFFNNDVMMIFFKLGHDFGSAYFRGAS